ncbi:hypothetical protein P7C71_g2693, partial [Lecanoromycetidae sp. Uapishka_2]
MITRTLLRTSRLLLPRHVSLTPSTIHRLTKPLTPSKSLRPTTIQFYATKTTADEKIEEIQELYATARDEFEIAQEETEKKTVYAADDRAAAHEELCKLRAAFQEAIAGEGGEEIHRRVGGRLRELERAVEVMDEMAMED